MSHDPFKEFLPDAVFGICFSGEEELDNSFILSDSTIEIDYNSTHQLSAVLNSRSDNLLWESSDEDIATVNQDGLVKGIRVGEAGITA
ncbi:Ig-like domain-containing protein [Anditalea andensis]|uniref:Ig-like domain-containing protein n=1 Tax=Anditalea andensis TaxID=1048983 RepID=UPI0005559F6F|nr:Ig-like domain-containing protein [Anditalea andensis]